MKTRSCAYEAGVGSLRACRAGHAARETAPRPFPLTCRSTESSATAHRNLVLDMALTRITLLPLGILVLGLPAVGCGDDQSDSPPENQGSGGQGVAGQGVAGQATGGEGGDAHGGGGSGGHGGQVT